MTEQQTLKTKTQRQVIRLLLVTVGMFGFGFALVPLYEVFCEITGLNGKTAGQYADADSQVIDESRTVTIQFLASNNAGMPWEFRPSVRELTVRPGEINTTNFYVKNPTKNTITAQAVPSVAPFVAAGYLHKTECFCFEQQELKAGESLDMPLRFIVDSHIPDEIGTMTLSYTLFDITERASGDLASN